MKQWPWYIATDCEYFRLLRSKPEQGRELEEETYGDPVPGRPGFVRCYTVAVCLSGEIYAEWGDGSQSHISGFQRGPGRGEEDLTVIPAGRVYYLAMSDDVDFVCIKPNEKGVCLEQECYEGPEVLRARPNSWVVCLRGEITVNGQTYGQLEAVKHDHGLLEVNCTPDAVYIHVWSRP